MLFREALKLHDQRNQERHASYEAHARAARNAAPYLAHALVDLANVDVSRIYQLQLQIEAESRGVRAEVAALERNLADVAGAVRQLSDALKELGDFENYVSVLAERVERVTSALERRQAQQQQQQQQQQPPGAPS